MSGIALVIPGADFSNSPLGQVTFSKTIAERAAEVVEAYATTIDSHTYDDELTILVDTLMRLGVWDTVNVFPMLGDTITSKIKNLNQNSSVTDVVYPNTATLDQTNNELKFVQTLNPSVVGEVKRIMVKGIKKVFSFVDCNRTVLPPQKSTAIGNNAITIGTVSGNVKFKLPNSVKTNEILIPSVLTERKTIGCYVDGDNLTFKGYINGTNVVSESINDSSIDYYIANAIGILGDGSETEGLYEGYIRLYAFGTIEDATKAKATIDALQEFLDVVKPRS